MLKSIHIVILGLAIFIYSYNPALAKNFLWTVDGGDNRIHLLGSIHALRPSDYPLPESYEAAYMDAEKIVLEVDLTGDNIAQLAKMAEELGTYKNGESLEKTLGTEKFAELNQKAYANGLSLKIMNTLEPWMVSLSLTQLLLIQTGYSPEIGLDKYFEQRASQEGKSIGQLETAEFQLRLFDEMPLDQQILFLEKSIEEFGEGQEKLEDMVDAWRNGEAEKLAHIMTEELKIHPGIAERLLYQRNRNWVDGIEALIHSDQDVLIIVGAGHLVGEQNIIDLLKARGHMITRAQ